MLFLSLDTLYPDGYEGLECYVDDCHELAFCGVVVPGYPPGEGIIQMCEGHAMLHYDPEYERLRLKWRLAGWGE